MTIRDIDLSEDETPVSFALEGIPPEWDIKKDMLKLHCIEGKPIELGRGGYGVVLYGELPLRPFPLGVEVVKYHLFLYLHRHVSFRSRTIPRREQQDYEMNRNWSLLAICLMP